MEWIVQNFEKLGITAILCLALYGRFRQWWVDGTTYKEVVTDLKTDNLKLETELKALADEARNAAKIQEEANRKELSELRQTIATLVNKLEGPVL